MMQLQSTYQTINKKKAQITTQNLYFKLILSTPLPLARIDRCQRT